MRQFRLVHVGVAAALAAAAVTAVGLVQQAGASSGAPSVFVLITPCRLMDTRAGSDNVGTRAAPIGSGEAVTFAVWGANGRCTIPTSATGIASNATAVNPTSASYVSFFPADANPRPTASNLNFAAGAAPTPNQVTVGLSAAGAIGIYNNGGTVDLVVDIVGYYQSAPGGGSGGTLINDDRYYTKTQIDGTVAGLNAALATKQTKPIGSRTLNINPIEFNPSNAYSYNWNISSDAIRLYDNTPSPTCASAVINLPDGAVVTRLAAATADSSATSDLNLLMYKSASLSNTGGSDETMASVSSGTSNAPETSTITSPIINTQQFTYTLILCATAFTVQLNKAAITYTLP